MHLHVLTPGPKHPDQKPRGGHWRHSYGCTCQPCAAQRAGRTPATCTCHRPAPFSDPTADGDVSCLTCGRPPATTLPQAA